jgi:tetratricopeptide (TPR) repeat protein
VDETAIAAELQQADQYRQKTEKFYHHDLQIRCSEWLQPPNVREAHRRQLRERLAGTCEWILTDPTFAAWNTSSPIISDMNRLLLICGNPGCGKTVLASLIMEHVNSQTKNVLFFPFSYVDATRQSIKDLVRSLIWQALVAVNERECWDTIHVLMSKGPVALSELWDALGSILKHDQKPWFLIIDGVDECNELDDLLRDRIPGLLQSNIQLRGALLGRPQILQHRAALPSSYLLQITACTVKGDINSFVLDRINNSSLLRDHQSKDLIIKTLQRQSEGMFLWVQLMIQDLQNASSAAEVCLRLDCLPKGLAEAYRQVFRHLHDSLGNDALRVCLVRNVLAFTTLCRRPLSFQELKYALALDTKLKLGRPSQQIEDFLPHYSAEQLVGICGNLIVISNDRVLLIHTSLKEFLTDLSENSMSKTNPRVLEFCSNSEDTHRLFATACIEYLQLGDYGLPWQDASCLPELRAQNAFLEYSSKHILYHISSSITPCPSLMESVIKFLKSQFCVSWIEHFFLNMTDDEALTTVLLDFDNFVAWVSGSSREVEVHAEMRMVLDNEMERRLQVYDINDPNTQRWILFTSFAGDFILRSPDRSETTTQPQIEQHQTIFHTAMISTPSPRLPTFNVDNLARRTMSLLDDGNRAIALPSHLQMDMILRIRNISTAARKLTDPLELLFKLLLRKADCIPVYALLVVSAFYFRIGKEEKGLLVVQSSLKKIEGSDTWLEFQILEFLAKFHYDRYEYEQAVPYLERQAAGQIKQRGKIDTDIAKVKILLAWVLHNLYRFAESEAVLLELIDHENRSKFLKEQQLFFIYSLIGGCRYGVMDYERAIIWSQKAMNLPNSMHAHDIHRQRVNLGRVLHKAGQYNRALLWFEDITKTDEAKGNPDRQSNSYRGYWHGYTLYKLQRLDESFAILHQALTDSDMVSEKVLPRQIRGISKSDIIRVIYNLGRRYLLSETYPRSLECFQLANKGWINEQDVRKVDVLNSKLHAAASFYGLGDFKQGLELLQGTQAEFSSYYGRRSETLLKIKFLIGFGLEQENSSATSDTRTACSSQTLPPFKLQKRRSFEDLQRSDTIRSQDRAWRYMLGLTEFSRNDFRDFF